MKHVFRDGFDIVCDFAKSRDGFLADARDGRRWLDFHGFRATSALGYNHPRLTDGAFLNRLGRAAAHAPSTGDFAVIDVAEFVSTFSRVGIPEDLPHLVLTEESDRAVDEALKAAFDWKARKNLERGLDALEAGRVLHFRQAYHGTGGYGLSLTNTTEARLTRHYPRHDWPRVSNPYARFPLEGANLRDTEDREIQSVSDVRSAFRERPHGIAALIVEPVQCRGGDNHFRTEFLRELRRACDEFEALLILDEAETGTATTGRFWCFEHHEIRPDLLVFGGKLGIGGLLASRRLDEVQDGVFQESGRVGTTWGGGPAAALRAARILETIEADELAANAAARGEGLLAGLRLIAERDDRLTNARGRGLLCAFDLPSGDLRDRLLAGLRQKGLLALPGGLRSVRLRPALSVSKAEAELAIDLIHDVLKSLS